MNEELEGEREEVRGGAMLKEIERKAWIAMKKKMGKVEAMVRDGEGEKEEDVGIGSGKKEGAKMFLCLAERHAELDGLL